MDTREVGGEGDGVLGKKKPSRETHASSGESDVQEQRLGICMCKSSLLLLTPLTLLLLTKTTTTRSASDDATGIARVGNAPES